MNLNQHIAACQALVVEDAANGELPACVLNRHNRYVEAESVGFFDTVRKWEDEPMIANIVAINSHE